ncbi:GNAT family N-acetyltransferase [Actinoplanes couchii]|uniref:N-acetyltransferase domain-containing protein n=1 Tax=Actinoplanes couchii TaxID=403638 RepID=A0ABQ3XUE9_9ACTN|nr:GNAT family N-acetyltransferase [Actinoplanes couchii]MDR6319405.1 ribosomal-protein-alanine N-acetyltransferase [Actinoplanes couchii]GID62055.1 hypothetical protein Aco03nite_104590 [Actinoplanes couchii]
MTELTRLHADHAGVVLAFETANRAYFAASITDRGDGYFTRFADGFAALLAEQRAGICVFYLLVDDDGAVLGRFNLYDLADGSAILGYRVAQHAAGRGLATATVRELCGLAATRHGLHRLRAATAHTNAASRKVLLNSGFTAVGPADPAELGGADGTWYERTLSDTADTA